MPPIEPPENQCPNSAYLKLDLELAEKYEEAPSQLAYAARLWIVKAVEGRIYNHGLTAKRVDTESLKILKKGLDRLESHIESRSERAIDRFLKPQTNMGQKMWLHSHLTMLHGSYDVKRLDEAFKSAFRYVVYPAGQSLKRAKLLDFPIDEEDALTRGTEFTNVVWIPVCAPEPRLAVLNELSDGLRSLKDLARQRDALNSKTSAENWLKTWKDLNKLD